jgi:hypothetical protein
METLKQKEPSLFQVDFNHPEWCTNSAPVSCAVNGKAVSVGMGNWRDLLVNIIEMFIAMCNLKIGDLYGTPLLPGSNRPFLMEEKPNGAARQLETGHWVYVDHKGADLVRIIGKLCSYCGVSLENVAITYMPKPNGAVVDRTARKDPANSATHDKPEARNPYPSQQKPSESIGSEVPPSVIAILREDYAGGLRFDPTAIRLLSSKAGIAINKKLQASLKQLMFRRGDDVFFLIDAVTDAQTRRDMVDTSDAFLAEFGCFEVSALYALYMDKLNPKSIASADDFEKFYACLGNRDVRFVPAQRYGSRIARYSSGNITGLFGDLAERVIEFINGDCGGIASEEDLTAKFRAFSAGLLSWIIKSRFGSALVRVEINGMVCYQALDTLGLPEGFSDILTETLERLDDLRLPPSEEVLHTALSLALGANFKSEYNIPDQAAYRRLVDVYYNASPPREWKYGVFGEAES